MNPDLVFIDTETTGLDPDRHEIWDLALIYADKNGQMTNYERKIKVRNLDWADPTALRLNRFYERYISPYSPNDLAGAITRITAGKHLVGAVPSFDAAFLERLLRSVGYAPAWHYHLIDVESLAAGQLGLEPPWKSDELSRALGVAPPNEHDRHTAFGDAYWAMRLYNRVMRKDETND